jgi:hypothetical protein
VWRVGSGRLVRLGLDPWPGCQLGHILPEGIRHRLALEGYYHLAQVGDPLQTDMWHQGWLSGHRLGLPEADLIHWNRYTQALRVASIRLVDRDDELIWDGVGDGEYTLRSGYIKLCVDLHQRDPLWWWRKIWKLTCPTKGKLLVWSILANKLPTWDNLQRRLFSGPGHCALCKSHLESVDHLFLQCPFVKEVWDFSRVLMPSLWNWQGISFELALKAWLREWGQEDYRAFPFILAWGIWITRNGQIFQDEHFSVERVTLLHWDFQIILGSGGDTVVHPRDFSEVVLILVSRGDILMVLPRLIRQSAEGEVVFISLTHITLPSKRDWGLAQTTTLNFWL